MNAPAKITAALPDLTAATERANGWVNVARPIILVGFALEDADSIIIRAWSDARKGAHWKVPEDHDARCYTEARGILRKPMREMNEMLAGIRDNFLCDECPPQPADDNEQAWTDRDAWRDALDAAVTTVEQAINLTGDEL